MRLCGGVFFEDLNVSPYLTRSTRPLTSRFYPNITTRQAELKPPARSSELSQGARTGRQEIRGVGDVRQVAEARVTTTFSSHRQALARGCLAPQNHDRSVGACTSPKPQAWILCSRHSYLLGDSGSLSFGSLRETPLTVKEAKGLSQAPGTPRSPFHSHLVRTFQVPSVQHSLPAPLSRCAVVF